MMACVKTIIFAAVALTSFADVPILAEDWLGQSGPKIQLMPKSDEFTLYSRIIPAVVQDDSTRDVKIYDISWPIAASKENGQWLYLQADGSSSRKPIKGWVNKNQLMKLDGAASEYYAKLGKGKDDVLYHWLLGVAWEALKQKSIAQYQYDSAVREAARENSTSSARARASWGLARLNAELFVGELTGDNLKRYRDRVKSNFTEAGNDSRNDVPGFYADWGIALERALPPVTKGLTDKLRILASNNPLKAYPANIKLAEFDGLRDMLIEILRKYDAAQGHVRDESKDHSLPAYLQFTDRAQWDRPHRLIGSLYARYRIKRHFSKVDELYIDVNGSKFPEDETKTVSADDEFVRALRREQNSQETRNQRATLLFTYFTEASSRASKAKALTSGVTESELNQAHVRIADAIKQRDEQQTLVDQWKDVIAAWDDAIKSKPVSPAGANTAFDIAARRAEAQAKRRDAVGDWEQAKSDLRDAQRELEKTVKVWKRTASEYLVAVSDYLIAVSEYFPVNLDLVSVILAKGGMLDSLKSLNAASVDNGEYEQRKADMEEMLANTDDLLQDSNLPKVDAYVDSIWQRAYDQAVLAAERGNYRNPESLNLLAQICYYRPQYGEPRAESEIAIEATSDLQASGRPMLTEAIRFVRLAAEYANEDKRLEYRARLFQWWNEDLGRYIDDVEPDKELERTVQSLVRATDPNPDLAEAMISIDPRVLKAYEEAAASNPGAAIQSKRVLLLPPGVVDRSSSAR